MKKKKFYGDIVINELSKRNICPACGGIIPHGSRFCSNCGKKLGM